MGERATEKEGEIGKKGEKEGKKQSPCTVSNVSSLVPEGLRFTLALAIDKGGWGPNSNFRSFGILEIK